MERQVKKWSLEGLETRKPIVLLLFVLVADSLNRMNRKAKSVGWLKSLVGSLAPAIQQSRYLLGCDS